MKFVHLTEMPGALPTIAGWYFDHWGHLIPGETLAAAEARLQSYMNPEGMPQIVLALDDDEVVGAAQLKFREMDIYPDREHWIGGAFVRPTHRGKHLASQLVTKIADIAKARQFPTLFLPTERLDSGLYARLGWKACDQVTYKGNRVLVMERPLTE